MEKGKKKKRSTFLDTKTRGVTPGTGNKRGAQAVFHQTKKGVGGGKQYNLPRKTF